MGEVLQDDDGFGARILELVLQFARRVEWIAVNNDIAGTQRTEHGDRILQHVRHHDRHTRALRKFQHRLQIRCEALRLLIELRVGDLRTHIDIGDPVAVLPGAVFEEFAQRLKLAQIDFGGHTFLITPQPNLVHAQPPLKSCSLMESPLPNDLLVHHYCQSARQATIRQRMERKVLSGAFKPLICHAQFMHHRPAVISMLGHGWPG